MTRASLSNRPEAGQHGFTLVEVVIAVVIMMMITGAMATAFVTASHSTQNTAQRARETDDAQVVASMFTRDAQGAGGTDPITGVPDPRLGVSTTDNAGCPAPGSLIVRFRSTDRSGPVPVDLVVNYSYDASNSRVVRTVCRNGLPSTSVLAYHVAASTAPRSPFAWCDGDESATCPSLPRYVSMRLTESNSPPTAATPYTYTLTASLRAQSTPPIAPGTPKVPLLLFGGAGCPAGNATGLSVSGALMHVHGQALINSGASDPACPAMRLGTVSGYQASGTSILSPGVCRSAGLLAGPCPAVTGYPNPMPDPYANLPTPTSPDNRSGCPGGHASPGVYTSTLTVTASGCTLDSGVYILRNGISITTGALSSGPGGVLLYITGGTFTTNLGALVNLSPMTSGPYAGLLLWQDKTDTAPMAMGNLALFALNGYLYTPTATLNFSNVSVSLKVGGIVAKSLVVANVGLIDIGT